MPRSRSSKRWLSRQARDPYVQRARAAGWRSRSAFKLLELDRRWRLLVPGSTVVDLGAAPGGWSQVAAARLGRQGRILAVDVAPMDPIPGVRVLQGDITSDATVAAIDAWLEDPADGGPADRGPAGGGPADLVLCDMAPNLSGIRISDQARALELSQCALDLASRWLQPNGALVIKLFEGEGVADWRAAAVARYARVEVTKPGASRRGSREIYALCKGERRSLVGPGNV